jgi:hypothetical protein
MTTQHNPDYLSFDGDPLSADAIRQAYAQGMARIVHGRGDSRTTSALLLDGRDWDTRDQCVSAWDESWTRNPTTLREAMQAAYAR